MSAPPNFTATHFLYILPRGGPSMKPAEAYDITSYITTSPGTKEFKSEMDKVINNTVKGADPPQPVLSSQKETVLSTSAVISTPSNPHLATILTPLSAPFTATIKFSDDEFHPPISIYQEIRSLSRTMTFIYNSRVYKWKWDLSAPSRLVIERDGSFEAVAFFYTRGFLRLSGVLAIDENKLDLSVAFATLLVCMKRERQRRHV